MHSKQILLSVARPILGDKLEHAFYRVEYDVVRSTDFAWIKDYILSAPPDAVIWDGDISQRDTQAMIDLVNSRCTKTALVILSERKSKKEKITALESGADDYMPCENSIDEVVTKVKALIRRIDRVEHTPRILKIKDIVINLDTHEVKVKDRTVDLTYTQFKILSLLCSHQDYVFSRNEILKNVWGDTAYVTDRTVDVHMKRLREKLGREKKSSDYIQTIHGLGYRIS